MINPLLLKVFSLEEISHIQIALNFYTSLLDYSGCDFTKDIVKIARKFGVDFYNEG